MNSKNYYKFSSSSSHFSKRLAARVAAFAPKFRSDELQILGDPNTFEPHLPSIGIVGTRRPTAYGLRFVQELMSALKGLRINILSGGALGIDAEAHAAALKNELPTQAWLVGPLLKPSPRHNWPLFQKIISSRGSALIVPQCLEPGSGKKPEKYQWVERNAWLVAACDVLIVVEANMKSGTYASVKAAGDLSVPAYLLPGSIFSEKSSGINQMISEGCGHIIASVELLVKTLIEELQASPYNNNWEARLSGEGNPSPGKIELKLLKFLTDIDCEAEAVTEEKVYERALIKGWSWWETTEKLALLLDCGILAKSGSLIERRSL